MNEQPLSDRLGFRIFLATCVTLAFCLFFFAKTNYGDKIVETLEIAGYREHIAVGPLTSIGSAGYLLGLPIFLFVLFLPQVMSGVQRALRLVKLRVSDGNLERCLYVATVYWLFSCLGWLVGKLDFLYLAAFVAVGGFYGIVEGIWKASLRPNFLDSDDLTLNGKAEMIKFEDNKWWRGLNLFWIVIVGIAVTGAISFALSPTPLDKAISKVPGYNSAQTAFLALSVVPGIASFIWYFIRRTNYLHRQLGELYRNIAERRNFE